MTTKERTPRNKDAKRPKKAPLRVVIDPTVPTGVQR